MALIRPRFSSLACWMLLGALSSMAQAEDISLRLHGSNTIGARLGPDLLMAYARSKGFVGVKQSETSPQEFLIEGRRADGSKFHGIVKAHGTNTGYADLKSGAADLWMASREAKAEEVRDARAIGNLHSADQEHVIALDGLAIVVHPDNPVSELSADQIRDAFAGRISNWSGLGGAPGPIRLYARDENSGTFDSFKTMVMSDGAQLSSQSRRFESSAELDRAVAADRQALGFVGFSHIAQGKAVAVRAAGTTALKADALSIATEDYLLARRLYLYSAREASATTREFLDFVQGSAGQKVTAAAGFVAQDIFVAEVDPLPGNPDGYYDVIADAERLSLNFRFRPQSATLDSRALRDIERVSDFMNQPANRGKQLRLAAFGISSERSLMMTLFAVNDRVDYISQILASRGVRTEMSRGFVDGAAVAPIDRAETRARNERVEVWLAEPRSPQG
ncbi:MAG: substrate-binding domain-containing protein [Xanthomonadales bacterium]|nr:substrate-binding domain-containing protein [Xanthomonadales bacterium]